jgi:LacI family transcriptional regulator
MPTIKDIARAAGVSYTTVSHVLNNSRPVSAKVSQSVRDVAEALNYVPSDVARALRRRTTGTIGMVLVDTAHPFFAELVRAIEEVCFQNRIALLLCNSYEDSARQATHIRTLIEKRVDGLLISPVGDFEALAQQLRSASVPVVFVDRFPPDPEADVVTVDQERAGYEATRHLLGLGHRQIGCITRIPGISVFVPRLAGYRRALQEARIEPRSQWVAEAVDLTPESGCAATERLLNQSPELTAIFALSDILAIGALRYAYQREISVPGALSIIGFDGVELGRYVLPALTSIGQPVRELGTLASTHLLERIRGGPQGPGRRLMLPPKLMVRDSTGLAPL